MKKLPIFLFLCFSAGASAQTGWVLFDPNLAAESETQETSGQQYLSEVVGDFYGRFPRASYRALETKEERDRVCVERLSALDNQLKHTLNGFNYSMDITITGNPPYYDQVTCRVQIDSNTAVKIEVKND